MIFEEVDGHVEKDLYWEVQGTKIWPHCSMGNQTE